MILNQPDFFARSATLDGAISDTDTQVTLTGLSTRFTDAVAAGTVRYPLGPFRISDDDGFELIAITGHVSGTTFEVERGIQGTTAEAWGDGTAIRAVVTAESNIIYAPWVSGQVGRAVPTESTKYIADDFVHDPTEQDDLLSTRTAPTGQQWFHDASITPGDSNTTNTGVSQLLLDNNRTRSLGGPNSGCHMLISFGEDLYRGPAGSEAYVVDMKAQVSNFAFDNGSGERSTPGFILLYIDSNNYISAFKETTGDGSNWELTVSAMIDGSGTVLSSVQSDVVRDRRNFVGSLDLSAWFGVDKNRGNFECVFSIATAQISVGFNSDSDSTFFDDIPWSIDTLFPTSTAVGINARYNRVFFHNFAARFDTR